MLSLYLTVSVIVLTDSIYPGQEHRMIISTLRSVANRHHLPHHIVLVFANLPKYVFREKRL